MKSIASCFVALRFVALLFATSVSTAIRPVHAQEAPPVIAFPVSIEVDASRSLGAMKPISRFFGADEPNYATMKDGQRLLGELGKIGASPTYFRTHSLLVSGDGTPALKWGSTNAYTEDAQGQPLYDWTLVDRIFDTYLARGVKPYVQIGFMPKALSVKPDPYQHSWTPLAKYDEIYTGWAYPPTSYEKWGELVYQWAKHCVAKYGRAEVETWYWETWNEPNIGYWRGTAEEFYRLHDFAVAAVRRALPTARVGGPDAAGGGGPWLQGFFDHCLRGKNAVTGEIGTPLDFLSFHAKGQPRFVDGHVRMGISNQLLNIDAAFKQIAAAPELKNKPIIIGESDPDGCAACQGPQLGYRNGTMYSSYTAASFARKYELSDRHGVNLEGALTWAFEFEDQPFFAGFRALSSNGLDLPVLNVFRMMGKMSGQRVATRSDHAVSLDDILKSGVRAAPDVAALSSLDANRLTVMAWHYHDDDVAGPFASVTLQLRGLPWRNRAVKVRHFRIDESHSNSFASWKKLGAPAQPTPQQLAELQKAGQLAEMGTAQTVLVGNGEAKLNFALPRQAVSLLIVEE